jgi:hypothetical protein
VPLCEIDQVFAEVQNTRADPDKVNLPRLPQLAQRARRHRDRLSGASLVKQDRVGRGCH